MHRLQHLKESYGLFSLTKKGYYIRCTAIKTVHKCNYPYKSLYSVFRSLPQHAARQNGTLKRFCEGENGEESAELWAVSRHKALE